MKLSLDALKERSEAVASEELLQSINGGLENACHTKTKSIGEQIGEVILWFVNYPH